MAAALQMLERKQAVLANNLANASTRGFKAEQSFARMLDNARTVVDTTVDTTAGTVTATGNPLDLALEGEGFFVIQTPNGERLVRTGSFQLDADRRLVDGQGNPILGEEGPVVLRPGVVSIDTAGAVQVNGRPVQRLRVERVATPSALEHEGGTRFVPDDSRQAIPAADRRVRQGALEESNVNPLVAMTDMMDTLVQFQAAQKVLTTIDAVRGISVTELAKPV